MKKESTSQLQKIESIILIVLFWAGILLPLIDNAFNIDPAPELVEKRRPAEKPVFRWQWSTIKEYPRAFVDYYRDHLGFRDSLIRWYNWFHIICLKTSPIYK
ncbi:hypothetical protein J7M23_02800, partial [Candidatus Sumerlaeota bacterium]|nr:hypothetical protein [Candidatus Sumerlaeota bacterium]